MISVNVNIQVMLDVIIPHVDKNPTPQLNKFLFSYTMRLPKTD